MAGTETKRIIELTEASTVQSGDFIAVDSNARGTKKVPTSALATSAALTAETNARAGADEQMSERMDGIEEQTALIQNPTKTVSGSLVSFTDGADMPMVACTAEIVPKQSGSGTPSPDNVRQISGWESVKTSVSGKNLLDADHYLRLNNCTYSNGVVTATVDDTRSFTGILQSYNGSTYKTATKISSTEYHFTVEADTTQLVFGHSGASKDVKIYFDATKFKVGETYIFTCDLVSSTNPFSWNNMMIRRATDEGETYEPYNPNSSTTPVNLGRTVYGGTLDVVSGVLVVTWVAVEPPASWWGYDSGDGRWSAGLNPTPKPTGNNRSAEVIAEAYETNTSVQKGGIGCFRYATNLYVYSESTTTPPTGKFCYPLATPQTYQLTPQEVNTLLGENNVWADSGDVEITYRRDISIVLENLENALSGSNSLNTMMMSALTENTTEEPTEDEAEDDMR